MAFRSGKRKDVKKQSYYVWFLGAKESKGLRGEEYIRPVLHYLLDKEKELEPMKVTLQVSNKGLKIIQNVPRKNNRGKTEQIKHFIPHHAITCALQESKPDDDIVCCILLIYNPLTKCPVHVHAYRCDSVETASTLRSQLQILIDRAENQKKFREIENRLAAKGLLQSRRLNSDGRSTRTDGSDRTEDSYGSEREDAPVSNRKDQQIASLYDSLAAELREKLGNKNNCPILLPPKDYDTVSRGRGRAEAEQRRGAKFGLNPVSSSPTKSESRHRESGSSGKSSSGIGSDEALSSAIQEVSSHFENKVIDPDTSSDEEDWTTSEAVPEDDEIIQTEWRRPPPRNAGSRYRSSPPSTPRPAPAPVPPTYLYGRKEPLPLADDMRNLSLKSGKDNYGKVRNGYEDYDQMKIREREVEVVYRRRSNPQERIVPKEREYRPVSYPNRHTPEPYRSSPDSRSFCREVCSRDYREPISLDSRYYHDQPVLRRNKTPDGYAERRRSEYYSPPEHSHQYHQHPDDRRKSAYFDLPVDSGDYRHSFAEPVSRRMPLGAHY